MREIYRNHPLPILESRLDWITATVRSQRKRDVLAKRAQHWLALSAERGNDRKAWRTPFYEGERAEGIAWGERRDDALCTLSGAFAGRFGPTLISWADNVSRLDVEVTLQEPDLTIDWAGYVNSISKLDNRIKSGQVQTRLIRTTPRGVTAYIGEGASDRMMRCYDKAAESEDAYPPGSWRWEVQYRFDRAMSLAMHLLEKSCSPQACLEVVCGAYIDFGVDVPTLCIPSGWRDKGINHVSDDERRLAWLKRSIAPMLDKMRGNLDTGVVLKALGLGDVIDTLDAQRQLLNDPIAANGHNIGPPMTVAEILEREG